MQLLAKDDIMAAQGQLAWTIDPLVLLANHRDDSEIQFFLALKPTQAKIFAAAKTKTNIFILGKRSSRLHCSPFKFGSEWIHKTSNRFFYTICRSAEKETVPI